MRSTFLPVPLFFIGVRAHFLAPSKQWGVGDEDTLFPGHPWVFCWVRWCRSAFAMSRRSSSKKHYLTLELVLVHIGLFQQLVFDAGFLFLLLHGILRLLLDVQVLVVVGSLWLVDFLFVPPVLLLLSSSRNPHSILLDHVLVPVQLLPPTNCYFTYPLTCPGPGRTASGSSGCSSSSEAIALL